MAHDKQRMESLLLDYGTTNRTDFRPVEIKPPVFTKYEEKPKCLSIRPPALKDIHTLCTWKEGQVVPFNLLHRPRPHIDTDPTKVQQPYFEPPDQGKEHAIKTRPRLVMTPAVSMDDIEDPEARAILLNDMYTSDMTRGMREGIREYFKVVAPLPDHPTESNPVSHLNLVSNEPPKIHTYSLKIRLPKVQPPYVSPEWRMQSVSWDQKQLRAYCDPTKEFWLARKLHPCVACDQSNAVNAHRKMICQMEQQAQLQRRRALQ